MSNKKTLAFPCPTENVMITQNHWSEEVIGYGGMDLKDYFAIRILSSLIEAKCYSEIENEKIRDKFLVNESYEMAKLMLEEREKSE